MRKTITHYSIEVHTSVTSGIITQVLFNNNNRFVGRIDFYRNVPVPVSYLWHPTSTTDENQIYLVLAMPAELFAPTAELLRTEKPWAIELWPTGPLVGAATDGYSGLLLSTSNEPVGEEERSFFRMLRI